MIKLPTIIIKVKQLADSETYHEIKLHYLYMKGVIGQSTVVIHFIDLGTLIIV